MKKRKNLVRWKKEKTLSGQKKEKTLSGQKKEKTLSGEKKEKTLSGEKKKKPCQVNHNHELGLVGRAGGVGGAPAEAWQLASTSFKE